MLADMSKEEIEDAVITILRNDGPDGHIDGYEEITSFINALMVRRGKHWVRKYKERKQ